MSGRRFRESSKRSTTESSEAELAHKNIIAVNGDLRRRLSMLEMSMSFRLGRFILRFVQPVLTLLRIKRFSNRPPQINVEAVWPRLKVTVTIFQPSAELIPVVVKSSTQELLNEAIDPTLLLQGRPNGPWVSSFEFAYPLGFHPFVPTTLGVRLGNRELRTSDLPVVELGVSQLFRPIDIAMDSIIEVRGDPHELRAGLKTTGSVAVVSTFRNADREFAVPHLLIAALRAEGFSIVVVDTSDELPDVSVDCDLLVHRRNIGWDFASWMSTLAAYPWLSEESENLLLINDSNIGPLAPLGPVIEQGRSLEADVWGLTDSWDIKYHLQSYFLHFNVTALRSGLLRAFVESFTFPSVKERIIGSGEVGLSQFMLANGLRLQALFPYTRLAQTFLTSFPERSQRVLESPENKLQAEFSLLEEIDELNFLFDTVERIRSSAPVNPTHYFWDILLSEGSPFIKRDLLTKNPDLVSGLHRLPAFVSGNEVRAILEEEMRTWTRTHPDLSLPLAFHWEPRPS